MFINTATCHIRQMYCQYYEVLLDYEADKVAFTLREMMYVLTFLSHEYGDKETKKSKTMIIFLRNPLIQDLCIQKANASHPAININPPTGANFPYDLSSLSPTT